MYGKIFEQMYDGTLADHWEALITFQQMIVLSGADGVFDMTPQSLARRTGLPLEIIERGIEILEAPDPSSRTPDDEGRRIVRLDEHRDWGWRIVNHKKYRDLRKLGIGDSVSTQPTSDDPPTTYIYFLATVDDGRSNPIKIGISKNPWARLSSLQTGSAAPLELVAHCKVRAWSEREIHEILKAHRHHGEWFNPDPPVLFVLDAVKNGDVETYGQLVEVATVAAGATVATTNNTDTDTNTDQDPIGSSSGKAPDTPPDFIQTRPKKTPAVTAAKRAQLKQYRAEAVELLEFLNEKAGRNYQPVPANIDFIVARRHEGFTVTQMRQVIVRKVREWSTDPKMTKYTRPATLFNRTNFAQYSGELVPQTSEGTE